MFLFSSLLLIVSSVSVATLVKQQCEDKRIKATDYQVEMPQLHDHAEQIYTKYKRIPSAAIINSGGGSLISCEAFNFPGGLYVQLTADMSTCLLVGVPGEAQARTPGFIIATNQRGSSLARVPIVVNALVLIE